MYPSRHFKNNLGEKKTSFAEERHSFAKERDKLIEKIISHPPTEPDTSIYTGYGGTVVLLLRLFETQKDKKHLTQASRWLNIALRKIPEKIKHPEDEISFIEGYAGIYSIASVVKYYDHKHDEKEKFNAQLLSFCDVVLTAKVDSNELLYGRAGYIQALLYAYKHTQDVVLLEHAEKVSHLLVLEGRKFSRDIQSKSPLMYSWHEKRYTGFAHGICGILYIIISVHQLLERNKEKEEKERGEKEKDMDKGEKDRGMEENQKDNNNTKKEGEGGETQGNANKKRKGYDDPEKKDNNEQEKGREKGEDKKSEKREGWWEEVMVDVRKSVDFVASTVFPSGNYPTRDDGTEDKLVQWCHGAPAAVILFCKAFEVFKDEKYKILASKGCDVVWERGLLQKGFGLCHGISGNAYCFLYTYKMTNDDLFLRRAVQFSNFAKDDKDRYDELISTPEAPYSLFEGIGGLAYLHNDLDLIFSNHPPQSFSYSFPTCEIP